MNWVAVIVDGVDFSEIYEVSDCGKVRNKKTGFLLKIFKSEKGYCLVKLSKNGKGYKRRLSRIVACAFLKRGIGKTEVNHKDGNKDNNHFTNLEWVNHSENIRHAFGAGLVSRKGEKNSQSKLKYDEVLDIRKKEGEVMVNDLAKQYSISRQTVYRIQSKKAWN